MASPELSVVIPAFNEEERLGETLRKISQFLNERGTTHEILVADDGSNDATAKIAAAMPGVSLLRSQKNQGKGAALRRGVLASLGRHVLLTDADLSTPIEDLEALEPHRDRAELVLGSRAVASSQVLVRQPIYREWMGKTFNKMIRLAGVRGLNDTQCGFKLLDGRVARRLFKDLVTRGFAYDVELVWLARRHGYQVVEIGVRWLNSPDSKVRPLIDPLKMILEILRFRWHHRALASRNFYPGEAVDQG